MAGLVTKGGFALLFSLLAAASALAAGDPTRPPVAWLGTGAAGEGMAGGLPRLQSVLMPQRGKPVAIISGQTVLLGGRFGDARLVRLDERMAVLEGPEGVTRLYLTPDVDKRMIATPSARPARRAVQGKETR